MIGLKNQSAHQNKNLISQKVEESKVGLKILSGAHRHRHSCFNIIFSCFQLNRLKNQSAAQNKNLISQKVEESKVGFKVTLG